MLRAKEIFPRVVLGTRAIGSAGTLVTRHGESARNGKESVLRYVKAVRLKCRSPSAAEMRIEQRPNRRT